MAGSTPFALSSVPPVSGLIKDNRLPTKIHTSSKLASKRMSSNTGINTHKMSDQPVNPITRKSSVFTIENLLAPTIKTSQVSSTNSRTSNTLPADTTGYSTSSPADLVQQQFHQYHHHHHQNLFSMHQQQMMPLGLADPAAYSYTYLGRFFKTRRVHS